MEKEPEIGGGDRGKSGCWNGKEGTVEYTNKYKTFVQYQKQR
jgi:hypothetical protein